jgi:hypothetical protein
MRRDEKRSEGRFLCADLVRLEWLDSSDNPRSEFAVLEDISPSGSCVQMEEPITPGAQVMLTLETTPFYGHVRYCSLRAEGYFIGLRFSNETMWSSGAVMPRHLLNLPKPVPFRD